MADDQLPMGSLNRNLWGQFIQVHTFVYVQTLTTNKIELKQLIASLCHHQAKKKQNKSGINHIVAQRPCSLLSSK